MSDLITNIYTSKIYPEQIMIYGGIGGMAHATTSNKIKFTCDGTGATWRVEYEADCVDKKEAIEKRIEDDAGFDLL